MWFEKLTKFCSLENIAGIIIRDSLKRGGQRRKLTFCTDGNAHLIGGYFEPRSGHSKDHLENHIDSQAFSLAHSYYLHH